MCLNRLSSYAYACVGMSGQAAAEERHKAMQLLGQVKATVEDAMACGR